MKVLIVHPNFPGQFKHLIRKLIERGDKLWVIHRQKSREFRYPGVDCHSYQIKRGNGQDTFPLVLETESKVLRGEAAAMQAQKLRKDGLIPNIIVGHPGWGDMLFMADVWPEVPQVHYLEFFYGQPGSDNDIADVFATKQTLHERQRTRMKNANLLLNLNQMSWGMCPTQFQRDIFPDWAKRKSSVIHDGIDTEWLTADYSAAAKLANGVVLRAGDPVITFINRTFEPYRGIHVFLEALHLVQARHPTAHCIMVGEDTPSVSYGASRQDGIGWLSFLKRELGSRLDWSRIHCTGTVTHTALRQIYRVSSAHVYLTYPFVLSWSLLEAMSCSCLVIGSDTEPVREVLSHGSNGLLVPFQDAELLSHYITEALLNPGKLMYLRQNARKTAQSYALPICLERQLALLDTVASLSNIAL
jgi:glycosyltransferase involved in cell wall biosynthesis